MICAKCARDMPADRPTCMYCGGPPVRASEEKAIPCPRCAVLMDKVDADALMLDVCKTCGATWYDRGELATRLKKPDAPAPAATPAPGGGFDVKYLPCPKCQRPMLRRAFGRSSGVILDVCGPHGAFVDAGELERMRAAIAAQPHEDPKPDAPKRGLQFREPIQPFYPYNAVVIDAGTQIAAEIVLEGIFSIFD